MRITFIQNLIDKIRGKQLDINFQMLSNQLQTIQQQMDFIKEQNKIFRNMNFNITNAPTAQGILKELQYVNFYILKRIKEISQILNIKIWLHGGTLLGAVRHKGFIPWDDDIDIGIMRTDFEKLKQYLENDNELEIKCFYFVPGICSRQPRVVFKSGYKPFFVDLFVYDECVSNNIIQTWNEFCEKKMQQVQELNAVNIHNNMYNSFDNSNDISIVDSIYDKYNMNNTIELNTLNTNAIIFNIDEGTNLIQPKTAQNESFVRCFKKEFIFPLKTLKFNNVEFFVPNCYEEYLIMQYGNYMLLPKKLEYSQHMINFDKEMLLVIHKTYMSKVKSKIIGYTAGAFDLFHIGHLNLLKRAKQNCDYLIVGVTTDSLIEQTKGHQPAIPLEERIEILKSCKYVDKVVVQKDLDKVKAWNEYHYDILFSGDDWKNNERWLKYEHELNKYNVPIKYFSYTQTTSSTQINSFLSKSIEVGKE